MGLGLVPGLHTGIVNTNIVSLLYPPVAKIKDVFLAPILRPFPRPFLEFGESQTEDSFLAWDHKPKKIPAWDCKIDRADSEEPHNE